MFYLKEGTLIQRHHSSTVKKCCLISVTPLLLLSSSHEGRERDRERKRESGNVPLLPHRHLSWDLSMPQQLKNNAHCYGSIGMATGLTETLECQESGLFKTPAMSQAPAGKCDTTAVGVLLCRRLQAHCAERGGWWAPGRRLGRREKRWGDKDGHHLEEGWPRLLSSGVIDGLVQRALLCSLARMPSHTRSSGNLSISIG